MSRAIRLMVFLSGCTLFIPSDHIRLQSINRLEFCFSSPVYSYLELTIGEIYARFGSGEVRWRQLGLMGKLLWVVLR